MPAKLPRSLIRSAEAGVATRQSSAMAASRKCFVTPAKAGVHERRRPPTRARRCSWIPAFAGMTGKGSGCLFSTSERGDRGEEALQPAHAALLRSLAGAGIGDAGVRHQGGKTDIPRRHVLLADAACELDLFFTPVTRSTE